jgi:hypothetical protein
VLAKTPDIRAPWIFGRSTFLDKFFYLALYSVRIFIHITLRLPTNKSIGRTTPP